MDDEILSTHKKIEEALKAQQIRNERDAVNSATQAYYRETGNADFGIPNDTKKASESNITDRTYREVFEKQPDSSRIEQGIADEYALAGRQPTYTPTQYAELKDEPTFIEPGLVDEYALAGRQPKHEQTQREKIEESLSQSLEYAFSKIYNTPQELAQQLNETLQDLDVAFNNSNDKVQELLGGEFNKDVIYLNNEDKSQNIPLYFILDLIIKAVQSRKIYGDTNEFSNIISKLNELREKAAKLQYSSVFNSDEKLSESTMDEIVKAKGSFDLEVNKTGDIEHLDIVTNGTSETVLGRNGDNYSEGATHWESSPMPLYEKDEKALADQKINQIKIDLQRINEVASKYFKNGQIPAISNFYSSLLDSSLDYSITSILYELASIKAKSLYDQQFASLAKSTLDKLDRVEQLIAEQNQIKETEERNNQDEFTKNKEEAIKEAKERYNSKSSLWKFVNRKISIKNQNFDSMEIDDIEQLYGGKGK